EDGNLFLATPVAGRSIGAVFVGRGAVSFLPPLAIERAEVRRVLGDSVVDARISAAAFVFTDSTLAEFERQLSFGPRPAASPGTDVLGDAIDHLVDGRRVVQPTLITALLNGDTNGFFYAHVKREHGEDLMFVVDPDDDEQVSLLRGGREGLKVQTVAEFRRAEDLRDTTTTDPARETHSPCVSPITATSSGTRRSWKRSRDSGRAGSRCRLPRRSISGCSSSRPTAGSRDTGNRLRTWT